MNTRPGTRLIIFAAAILLMASSTALAACKGKTEQPPAPSSAELSQTMVPNVPLDIYVYARQESPTTIPGAMLSLPQDVTVDSLAVWGTSASDNFAVGLGLVLTSESAASSLYGGIATSENVWKKLSGKTIYLVQGYGQAAESLKKAINSSNFKRYDDGDGLQAIGALPSGGATRLAVAAIAKASPALIKLVTQGSQGSDTANMVLKLVNLKIVAAGLYSPQQIDIVKLVAALRDANSIQDLDLGVLLLVRSGLPGLVVGPAVGQFLGQYHFAETKVGDITLYKGALTAQGVSLPVMVRIKGSDIYAALSGKESYAQTLITSISQ